MLKRRFIVLALFFCLAFLTAAARLAQLQFYRSDELRDYREDRLRRQEQVVPRRGRILDAAGSVLAEDQPSHDLWLTPAKIVRSGGRRRIVSSLEPLTVEQMLEMAGSGGEKRNLEITLAAKTLAENNPLAAFLSDRLKKPAEEVGRKLVASILSGRNEEPEDLLVPRLAWADAGFELAVEVRAAMSNPYSESFHDGLEMRLGGKRAYPEGALFGHITGTTGKLTAEEYEILRGRWDGDRKIPGKGTITKQGAVFFSVLPDAPGTGMTDEEAIIRLREIRRAGKIVRTYGSMANETVGRGGLEQYYNQELRGRHSLQRLRLGRREDGEGRSFLPVGETGKPRNGLDIAISIRADMQRQVAEIMKRHLTEIGKRRELVREGWTPSGVAIVMDPHNGRILSLVSLPTYDPNSYSADFDKLLADPGNPLMDRAIAGMYPPGSVVKPVVGLAALSEDAVTPGQRFNCDHILMLAGARFTCLGRHGDMDVESALMHSCNMYFYHAGENLGSRKLYEWYARYGLGHKTGIDIAGETGGLLPRAAYTRRGWATGNTYHLSIGQGMAVTPLQLAVAYSALANSDGRTARIVRPHLLVPTPGGGETGEERRLAGKALELDAPRAEISVDGEALAIIRQGMWEVVQGKPETGELGTGQLAAFRAPSGEFLMEVAGKTGTAEWSKSVNGRPVKQTSHVWFAGYAPFDRPRVVVVVMIPEAGYGGGSTCAPIAKDILRLWFNLPDIPQTVGGEGALG